MTLPIKMMMAMGLCRAGLNFPVEGRLKWVSHLHLDQDHDQRNDLDEHHYDDGFDDDIGDNDGDDGDDGDADDDCDDNEGWLDHDDDHLSSFVFVYLNVFYLCVFVRFYLCVFVRFAFCICAFLPLCICATIQFRERDQRLNNGFSLYFAALAPPRPPLTKLPTKPTLPNIIMMTMTMKMAMAMAMTMKSKCFFNSN